MIVNLYRLFAVQNFKGDRVAVYVNEGTYPDPEILGDAEEISRGLDRKDLINRKPWLYEEEDNKKTLTKFTRYLTRSREIIETNRNVTLAIFVESRDMRTWHGTKTIYYNEYFNELKSDTPEYSGCKSKGTITL